MCVDTGNKTAELEQVNYRLDILYAETIKVPMTEVKSVKRTRLLIPKLKQY